jgi:alkanesulfonate monooxygenase SsuD/methylene tetrahydromethanopterin reductase-like flavin-dependent oxidoreductase (luciferase family)
MEGAGESQTHRADVCADDVLGVEHIVPRGSEEGASGSVVLRGGSRRGERIAGAADVDDARRQRAPGRRRVQEEHGGGGVLVGEVEEVVDVVEEVAARRLQEALLPHHVHVLHESAACHLPASIEQTIQFGQSPPGCAGWICICII